MNYLNKWRLIWEGGHAYCVISAENHRHAFVSTERLTLLADPSKGSARWRLEHGERNPSSGRKWDALREKHQSFDTPTPGRGDTHVPMNGGLWRAHRLPALLWSSLSESWCCGCDAKPALQHGERLELADFIVCASIPSLDESLWAYCADLGPISLSSVKWIVLASRQFFIVPANGCPIGGKNNYLLPYNFARLEMSLNHFTTNDSTK